MLEITAGGYSLSGVSVGGLYTALKVKQLSALLDVGFAARSFAGVDNLFLSHGHADHIGALNAVLGLRGLLRKSRLRVFLPAEIQEPVTQVLSTLSGLQRYDLTIDAVPVRPSDEFELRADLSVRAFRTYHPVPSVGYQFFQRVNKLRPEYRHLSGNTIAELRQKGEPLFDTQERLEFAYATDTLVSVLSDHPSLFRTKVLVLECSFLDDRKDLEKSRAGCHIHLDELLEHAERFENEALVLMHFSQLYSPSEVHEILRRRCPRQLFERIVAFAPQHGDWP